MKGTIMDNVFTEIGCTGDAQRLVAMVRRHIDNPEKSNSFWEQLKPFLDQFAEGAPTNGKRMDSLYYIHTHINNVRELFEQHGDDEALQLLKNIEEDLL